MALTLLEFDLEYPPKHKMPKEQGGFRLCKLVQYPATDDKPQSDWLLTTSFSTTMEWKGMTISVSTWNRTQSKVPDQDEISMWLNGATDEQLIALIEEGIGYVYMHESLTMLPMTVSEYEDYLSKNVPSMKKASSIPEGVSPA